MNDSIITNNDDYNNSTERSDEIASDIISLIHSTTHSSYVTCSQLSSKLFSYLSEANIHDHEWNDLEKSVQRFDQSIDHPDLRRFRQLIETISTCSNDAEERNYTLGRDANTLLESIRQLQELLQSHVNLNCNLLSKLIDRKDIQLHLIDLMNLTGMNVGNTIHGVLCDIVHLLCEINRKFCLTNVIDHPIVSNCIRIIQTSINSICATGDNVKSTVIFALRLLTDLLLTNELFPVHSYGQLSNCVFLKSIFDLIENNGENDELILTAIKFILSFNLRFDSPHENPLMLTLLAVNEQLSCRELIERLILLFNRSVDPIECKTTNSIMKFFSDLFADQAATSDAVLYDSDRRLIVEIISRELSDRATTDESTTAYLSLLELILRSQSITSETCPRIDELQTVFRAHLYAENCLKKNRFIINDILRQHYWLSTNDMPFYL
ncbi:unnamed protein product [Rotaria socialis]|uniref:SPIN90/Ldb17 leucine-rich domain-containing protein n=1 Tax=Rotaria socialis TaxID=392032 RepID=A0A821A6J4_9BILA|nr:unnamed protein product [Rotaria socialis]CAF3487954.1 unnamed protein product [Rotaria socialis]CAF4331223.1 unnamed protein product [Rotaria socialis]CAF4572444.1 unnamed protein product [Rotaria socialis]